MKEMNKFGIGFWIGALTYSLINMMMNLNKIPQTKILNYNYIITGVAFIGLIINIILWRKAEKEKEWQNSKTQ